MPIITEKIKKLLEQKQLSQYKLAKLVGRHRSTLGHMINADKNFSDEMIEKIAPVLGISPDTIHGWIIVDKYPLNILKRAIELKKEYPNTDEPIITTKIHELMQKHNLIMETFSTTIGYNQGWLSQVTLGKEPVSDKLMKKLCAFSGFSEEEIMAWSVADKYSLEALEVAVNNL